MTGLVFPALLAATVGEGLGEGGWGMRVRVIVAIRLTLTPTLSGGLRLEQRQPSHR